MGTSQSKTRLKHKQLLEEQGIEGFMKQIGGGGNGDYIRTLSIALTHFCFRNGPVESLHADLSIGLTEERMKTLNKFMVDKLGLFLLLLSVEDADTINSILARDKLCGAEWDDPDLASELERYGIDPERIRHMAELVKGSGSCENQPGSSKEPGTTWRNWERDPDAPLEPCPYCGSELLHRELKTRLVSFVDRSELGTNKRVAEAAGVPLRVVSNLQHYSDEEMTGKLKEQANLVADVLGTCPEILYSFDPRRSMVRCINCRASAPWTVWNTRSI